MHWPKALEFRVRTTKGMGELTSIGVLSAIGVLFPCSPELGMVRPGPVPKILSDWIRIRIRKERETDRKISIFFAVNTWAEYGQLAKGELNSAGRGEEG